MQMRPLSFLFRFFQPTIRIGVVSDAKYCGEREVAWRIKLAAKSLGWKVFLDEKAGHKLKKRKNLDWIICLLPENEHTYKHCPSYLTIFHPFNYLDSEGKLKPFYEKYDGYLLTINQTEQFKNDCTVRNKCLLPSPFYPTIQYVEYKELPLNNLVTMIPVWGNRYTDEKFKKIYDALNKSGFTKFYGLRKNRHLVKNNYMGELPFDGVSVIKALQKHGITLIFHSEIHNEAQIPSARIFEATAASTVIISDENAFVKKHFGETVFYVDTSLSAEQVYEQIVYHMQTIRQSPGAALAMAKNAREIFVNNFLMTHQLMNIHSMHELQKSKTMN